MRKMLKKSFVALVAFTIIGVLSSAGAESPEQAGCPLLAPPLHPLNCTEVLCLFTCESDHECEPDQVCCQQGCCRHCIDASSGSEKPGICPAVIPKKGLCDQKLCKSQCQGDQYCRVGQKCCSDGCCQKCTKPAAVKSGQCPSFPPDTIGPCIARCSDDSDCRGKQKCCSRGCELLCLDPEEPAEIPQSDNCPPILPGPLLDCSLVRCAQCGPDTCSNGRICCKVNNCCSNCVEPPKVTSTIPPISCPIIKPLLGHKKCRPCKDECKGDNSCPSGQKCCSDGCCKKCRGFTPISKPGFCPRPTPDESTICLVECETDAECEGDAKCCSPACHRHCMSPIAKPGSCPAGRPFDPEECALVLCAPCRDEDCAGNQICCRDGCCDRCVKPLGSPLPPLTKPVVRPGSCPLVRPPMNCDLVDCRPDACVHDGSCAENEKCCSVGCCKDCVKVIPEPVVKPGQCPVLPPGTVGTCILECSGDEDCAGSLKCCSNGCGQTCQQPASAPKPGKCPLGLPFDPEECAAVLCLACEDEDCPAGQRCCQSGCCSSCTVVMGNRPKPTAKPGRCPVVPPGTVGPCVEECSDDSDCGDDELCCSNGCGHTCQSPATRKPVYATTTTKKPSKRPGPHWAKPGFCPMPEDLKMCTHDCQADHDCEDDMKCCQTSCSGGTVCMQPGDEFPEWWKAL